MSGSAEPGRLPATVVVTFALTLPTAMAWLYFIALGGPGQATFARQFAYAAGKVVQFSLPLLFLACWHRSLREPMADLLRSLTNRRGLMLGLGFGLLVGAVIVAGYYGWLRPSGLLVRAGGRIRGKIAEFGIDSGLTFLALSVFLAVAHSFLEEYYWRWFVFRRLCDLVPVSAAMVISSLGFMAHHVLIVWAYLPDRILTGVVPASAAVAAGGLAWSWIYHRGNSLLAPWLSHALVDAALFLVGWDLLQRG